MPEELPKLALFCEQGAFFPLAMADSARGLCRMVWVLGSVPPVAGGAALGREPEVPVRLLRRMGEVVEARGPSAPQIAAQLAPLGVQGLLVVSEAPQQLAAQVAQLLGLPYHSPATATVLSDKLAQREALRAAGIPVPRAKGLRRAALDGHGGWPEGMGVSFPAVLKPRFGAGSRNTFMVEDAGVLRSALDSSQDDELVLEEYVPGPGDRAARLADDLVSAEIVVQEGEVHVIALTGRFPIAFPFRSTGAFLPADLPTDDEEAVVQMATRAVEALGVHSGVLNADLKISAEGPRVIEVNGRVGGGVPSLMASVGGPPLLTWAMRLALGLEVGPFERLPRSPVAFYRLVLAPYEADELVAVGGLEQLRELKGVDVVTLNREPGQSVDYREGGIWGNVLSAEGVVPQHSDLPPLLDEIEAIVNANFRYR